MLFLETPNVQAGHTVLQFDPNNAEQVAQAKAQVEAMMKLGFSIFAEVGGKKTVRVTEFDAKNGKFLIGNQEVEDGTKLTATAPRAGGCASSNSNFQIKV